MKVCKFGGTSMATAASINCVADIINADPDRRFVVVSAPGKRAKEDIKVTDLLYACYESVANGGVCDDSLQSVEERFNGIVKDLKLNLDLTPYFDDIRKTMNSGADRDYCASRGEYLSAVVMAARLGFDFIDATEIIKFFSDGRFDAEYTNDIASVRLSKSRGAVIPGFYGLIDGCRIKTFSRGGSDVSGAIVARAVKATVYENWTDVNGFLMCDPRIVKNPANIQVLTYKELRELSYMGATVLHPDSIFPVRNEGIPINIRNTFEPEHPGTMIIPSEQLGEPRHPITGIVGKKNFISIHIEKSMMNNELGFIRKALTVLEHYNISVEHIPSGIDTMSLIIDQTQLTEELTKIVISELKSVLSTDRIYIDDKLALIATVGHGMASRKGTAATLFGSLSAARINCVMIDQGSSEMNIIVAVREPDYEKAINAIYSAFVPVE